MERGGGRATRRKKNRQVKVCLDVEGPVLPDLWVLSPIHLAIGCRRAAWVLLLYKAHYAYPGKSRGWLRPPRLSIMSESNLLMLL